MKIRTIVVALAVCLLCSAIGSTEVPNHINFQGTLTDSTGCPISGARVMTFAIYEDSIGGSPLWNETQTEVHIDGGLFRVQIGSENLIPPGIFNGGRLWLGITVSPDVMELSPRQPLITVPYGFKSVNADYATEADIAIRSTYADTATWSLGVGGISHADTANFAWEALHATQADNATNAESADHATHADSANAANFAHEAGLAGYAAHSDTSQFALLSESATFALSSQHSNNAYYADEASLAEHAAHADTAQFAISATPDNDWTISASNIYRLTGNVGIGTPNPTDKLQVDAIAQNFAAAISGNANGGGPPSWSNGIGVKGTYTSDGVTGMGVYGEAQHGCGVYGKCTEVGPVLSGIGVYGEAAHGYGIKGSCSDGFAGYFEGKGYFSDSVGIGTINPDVIFQIGNGSHSPFFSSTMQLDFDDDNVHGIEIHNNSGAGYWGVNFVGEVVIGSYTSGRNLYFTAGGLPRQTINGSNGYVGIGTLTPSRKLHVYGDANPRILVEAPAGQAPELNLQRGTTTHAIYINAGDDLVFYRAGDRVTFTDDGDVGIGTTSPGYKLDVAGACHASSFPTSSDQRLKTNVHELDNVLDKLEHVRGVSFDWNSTYEAMGRSTGHREIGVIAQEIETQFPELVTTWGDQNYRGVDYGRLTAVLIEAVKQLKSENDTLREDVNSLRNDIESLKALLGN